MTRNLTALPLAALFGVAALVGGCEYLGVFDGPEPPPSTFSGEHIETDRDTYEWKGDSVTIEYVYKNRFEQTVFMAGCGADGAGPAHLFEKRTDSGWATAYHRICLAVLAGPPPVQPGQMYEAAFELDERKVDGSTRPSWRVDSVPGTYRIREPMFWTWDKELYLDEELETGTWLSNEFEIQ